MGKMSFVFSGAVLLSFLLSGCVASTSSSSGSSTSSTANAAPIIVGVTPEVTIHLGETFDALAGVSATDLEDGNLTNRIIISSTPTLVNNDGILFPDAQGEYYLTYPVTDNGLLTSEEYAT
jgi:chitinase